MLKVTVLFRRTSGSGEDVTGITAAVVLAGGLTKVMPLLLIVNAANPSNINENITHKTTLTKLEAHSVQPKD